MARLRAGRKLSGRGARPHRGRSSLPAGRCTTLDNQIDTTTGTVKAARAFRQQGRRPLSQPVRQHPAAGEYAARRHADPGLGHPAERRTVLRLRDPGQRGAHAHREAGRDRGRHHAGRGHRIPGDVVANSSFDKLQDNCPGRAIARSSRTGLAAPRRSGRPLREPVPPVHPAAGRDLAADGGDPPRRHRRRYTQLPVSALPEVDYPTIQVVTFYPGASPDVMATTVTAPLERQFGEMQGLSQMTSTSSGGISVIVLQFTLSPGHRRRRAGGAVGHQRRAELSALATCPRRPIYSKTNPADAPVLTLAITSDSMPLSQVEDLVDTRLAPKISQLQRRRPRDASAAARSPRCASRPTPRRCPPTASTSKTCARRWSQTSVNAGQGQLRRAAPGLPDRRQRPAGDQRRLSSKWWWPTAMARRSCCTDVAKVTDGIENKTRPRG